jgi:transcriptional regulator GlxA family with amidase domain
MPIEKPEKNNGPKRVGVLLFEEFETLDVFGPVEIFGVAKGDYTVSFYSELGGAIKNSHGVAVHSLPLSEILDGVVIFLVPGGYGTRREVLRQDFLAAIKQIAEKSHYVLTVCTGSALLAKTGLLDGRAATSNRRAFEWVKSTGPNVHWDAKARWTVDGKYYSSAGVSAGMDMVLGFLSDRHGTPYAEALAVQIEYHWHREKGNDSF